MDLIERQAALDAINTWPKYGVDERNRIVPWYEGLVPYVHLEDVVKAIVGLPSAQPEQRWIPCTPETMPETSDEVLTTYIVNGNRKKRYVETATWYDGDEGYWSSPWDEYRVAGTRVEVIAWMPLPEPYQEGQK